MLICSFCCACLFPFFLLVLGGVLHSKGGVNRLLRAQTRRTNRSLWRSSCERPRGVFCILYEIVGVVSVGLVTSSITQSLVGWPELGNRAKKTVRGAKYEILNLFDGTISRASRAICGISANLEGAGGEIQALQNCFGVVSPWASLLQQALGCWFSRCRLVCQVFGRVLSKK